MDDANAFLMGGGAPRRKAPPMDGMAAEIAGRFKELFYAYGNRQSDDNRSAQVSLGPSEIGTPCDRRLAMRLLRVPPVNPGGDGWAAFVGTRGHIGLASMFDWANGTTGRYGTELSLELPSAHVPRGTGDLLDRSLHVFYDHKFMGNSALSKFRFEGPSDTYRTQIHLYGLGAVLAGELVEHVAIVAWPREAGSLTGLHVWTEPYDDQRAREALARVDRIAERLESEHAQGWESFPTADDCHFCPYYTKTNKGCKGHGKEP